MLQVLNSAIKQEKKLLLFLNAACSFRKKWKKDAAIIYKYNAKHKQFK